MRWLRTPGRSREERATRISARPTSRGWQAIVIGAIVVFVALLIGTTQFHQLGYALLMLPVAAFVIGFLSSRRLGFSRVLSPSVRFTAGEQARIDLRITNGSRFDIARASVTDRLPEPKTFEAQHLYGNGGTTVEVPVTFARRGIYELGPAEVRVLDPFGLLRFSRKFTGKTEVVVYPKVHELPGFPLRGGNSEAGSHGARGQRGDEFAGLREYRRGDDRRHIHWKSVARTGELFVKEFALEAPRRYTVALDLRRVGLRVQEAEVEDAVSAAASILTHLLGERLPARLLCTDGVGSKTEFGAEEASYWRAMRTLATVRTEGYKNLGEAVLEERESLGEGVVLVSRGGDEELPTCVRKLRGASLLVIVVLLASHTYRGRRGGPELQDRETEFAREVGRLEAAGAQVLAARHPGGIAELCGGARVRGTGVRGAG